MFGLPAEDAADAHVRKQFRHRLTDRRVFGNQRIFRHPHVGTVAHRRKRKIIQIFNMEKERTADMGSAQRMKDVAKLITGERNIVVLSAMSGTTNSLVEISDYLYKKNPDGANEVINKLAQKYYGHIEELYSTDEYKQKAKELIKHHFDHIRTFTKDLFTLFEEKVVLAQGELISTGMMNLYLNECGINSVLIPALDYMRTDKNAEPDPVYIKEKLIKLLDGHKDADLFITQGYICRNAYGEIDNLQRGGSDYSASLIGAAIGAEEIQIWTDIDGMHNNDPRIVEKTSPVRHLHFEEAADRKVRVFRFLLLRQVS